MSSVFASQHKREVVFDDLVVMIRKLSGRSLQSAREVRRMVDAKSTRAIGGEVVKALADDREERDKRRKPTTKERTAARLSFYDRDDILNRGIDSWSAAKRVEDGIGDLDEPTSQKLFEEIIDFALGPVVDDPAAEAEEEKEQPSSRSTDS